MDITLKYLALNGMKEIGPRIGPSTEFRGQNVKMSSLTIPYLFFLILVILTKKKDCTRSATQIIIGYYLFPSPFARKRSESSQHEK